MLDTGWDMNYCRGLGHSNDLEEMLLHPFQVVA